MLTTQNQGKPPESYANPYLQFCWALEVKGLLTAAQREGEITQKVPLASSGPTVS